MKKKKKGKTFLLNSPVKVFHSRKILSKPKHRIGSLHINVPREVEINPRADFNGFSECCHP